MCGWSKDFNENSQFRSGVLKRSNLDILCVTETFLRDDEIINVNGYRWVGINRKVINANAKWGSGGVGILVRDHIWHEYNISKLPRTRDGVLWLQFTSKDSGDTFCICVCYLPPKGLNYQCNGDLFQDLLHVFQLEVGQ